jgi:hypothetical protein
MVVARSPIESGRTSVEPAGLPESALCLSQQAAKVAQARPVERITSSAA